MKKKGLLFKIIILIFVLILVYILLNPAFNYLSGYLSKSEQVSANVLIVEGWLPDYALEMAYKESRENKYDNIIITGIRSTSEYFRLAEVGFLIFYPRKSLSGLNDTGPHSIEVDAFSELGGENRAHFNLYINDSLAADFFAEKQKKRYSINWNGDLNEIDSIMVEFTNDFMGDFGDRNLFIKDIKIDHKITIPFLNNSAYEVTYPDGKRRIINNYISNAELTKKRLVFMGMDPSQITAVSGDKVRINRTLTSALAFRDWLKTSDINIKGIKIISMGTHARRTWMTYNRVLNEKYKIGIISLPDYKYNRSKIVRLLKTIRETLGIIYYWFILLPY